VSRGQLGVPDAIDVRFRVGVDFLHVLVDRRNYLLFLLQHALFCLGPHWLLWCRLGLLMLRM
jgi:hypothetical protein